MPPTTEIKPGVHVDMSRFGRRPDQAVLDMGHQARSRQASHDSTLGALNAQLGIGAADGPAPKIV